MRHGDRLPIRTRNDSVSWVLHAASMPLTVFKTLTPDLQRARQGSRAVHEVATDRERDRGQRGG
jgi:hypothetical protein